MEWRICQGAKLVSDAATATNGPKRRAKPLHSSSGIGGFLATSRVRDLGVGVQATGQDAPYALWGEHNEGDEYRSEDERPKIGDLRQLMLEEHEEHAAEDRANQRAGPAHDHHDEDAARDEPEEQLG